MWEHKQLSQDTSLCLLCCGNTGYIPRTHHFVYFVVGTQAVIPGHITLFGGGGALEFLALFWQGDTFSALEDTVRDRRPGGKMPGGWCHLQMTPFWCPLKGMESSRVICCGKCFYPTSTWRCSVQQRHLHLRPPMRTMLVSGQQILGAGASFH